MNRLTRYLTGEVEIRYPEDITKLRAIIPELAGLLDYQIQELYERYSEETHCAGWLIIDDSSVVYNFQYWLLF